MRGVAYSDLLYQTHLHLVHMFKWKIPRVKEERYNYEVRYFFF
jgi:hypothetical protein